VPAYLAELPEDRRPALKKVRNLCREILKDCEETMRFGMPCYQREGEMVAAFASQKRHVAIYVGPAVLDAFAPRLGRTRVGRGCIRYAAPDQMDFDMLRKILQRAAQG